MISPLSNRLVVERVKVEKIGHIFLTNRMQDDNNIGGPKEVRILAVGPGRLTRKGVRVPIECEPGDRAIIFSHTAGPEPIGDGKFIITDDQILAVIPNKPIT